MQKVLLASLLVATAPAAFAYRNSAWVPPWSANALTSLQSNLGVLTETNPVWYVWNADGSIAKVWNAENSIWRAAMTGTEMLPTVQNVVNNAFDGTLAATILGDANARDAQASQIAQLAVLNAYDGIDIDYERLPASARANFTAFLTTLAQKLHASNKKLSVTVYAKTSDTQNWSGPGAEDWAAIGSIADSVKIMAYDYSWSTSLPGPIAPLGWIDQVASYAQSVIPNAKIMMGLPWYGYDWNSAGPTADVSYASAAQIALNNGATIGRDVNGEATFTYSTHTVFFQDASSYSKKVDLLKQRHASIGGFAAWAAGQEDPAIWNVIRGAGAPAPATPPPADFSISGPASLMVTPGSVVTGDYHLTAINSFNGTASVSVVSPAEFNGTAGVDPSVSAGGVATLRIGTTLATVPGVYTFTIQFSSGSLTHTQSVSVTVSRAMRHRVSR